MALGITCVFTKGRMEFRTCRGLPTLRCKQVRGDGDGGGDGDAQTQEKRMQSNRERCPQQPFIQPRPTRAAGMLVTVEPGYYEPGAFGIRIENVTQVT
jgi:hypothetical protein